MEDGKRSPATSGENPEREALVLGAIMHSRFWTALSPEEIGAISKRLNECLLKIPTERARRALQREVEAFAHLPESDILVLPNDVPPGPAAGTPSSHPHGLDLPILTLDKEDVGDSKSLMNASEEGKQLIAEIKSNLTSDDPQARRQAAKAFHDVARNIGEYRPEEILDLYDTGVKSADPVVRRAMAASLGAVASAVGEERAYEIPVRFSSGLGSTDFTVCRKTIKTLGDIARAWGPNRHDLIISMSMYALLSKKIALQRGATMEIPAITRVLGPSHPDEIIELCRYVIAHCDREVADTFSRKELDYIAKLLNPKNPEEIIRRIKTKPK